MTDKERDTEAFDVREYDVTPGGQLIRVDDPEDEREEDEDEDSEQASIRRKNEGWS